MAVGERVHSQVGICEADVRNDLALYGEGSEWLCDLHTPHPTERSRYGGIESKPLHEMLDIEGARQTLGEAAAEGDDRHDEARVAVAHQVSQTVRMSLRFFPGYEHHQTGRLVRPDLEWISRDQQANCFGFTLVASSLLERIGIEHSIGFLNGHAFITVFTGTGDQTTAWYIDPFKPDFKQDMSGLYPASSLEYIREQMFESGRSTTSVSSRNFAPHLGRSVTELARTYLWVMKHPREDTQLSDEQEFAYSTRLTLTVFEMNTGRVALERYLRYRNAYATDNLDDAVSALQSMSGLLPELDPDATVHHNVFRITDALCENGSTDAASLASAIRTYFSNFGPQPHPTIAALEAACWDRLAQYDQQMAEQG